MKKWEAGRELQKLIEKETGGNGPGRPDDAVTFGWFWRNRFLPLKEGTWRRSTRETVASVMTKHVLPKLGETPLCEVSRFDLQSHLNMQAEKHSRSIVQKIRTWTKAVLDEAVEQDFLAKNPARKLEMPHTRGTCKRFLSEDEVQKLLVVLDGRDRLIVHILLLAALRPGELFALRWRCVEAGGLRIAEAVYRGKIGETKTEGSRATIWIPKSIDAELANWRTQCGNPSGDGFVFPATNGAPIDTHNYLQRVLQPAAERAGIKGASALGKSDPVALG
jgi:integrase